MTPTRLNGYRGPHEPELLLNAFTQVPRTFWVGVTPGGMDSMIYECEGRLTLPEREHLWRLLGHTEDPPRLIRLVFDPDVLLRLWPSGRVPAPDRKTAMAAILEALRQGRHAQ